VTAFEGWEPYFPILSKEGLWRMKVGVTRPDPKPGFPAAAQPLDL
jgi:hypothetical protein